METIVQTTTADVADMANVAAIIPCNGIKRSCVDNFPRTPGVSCCYMPPHPHPTIGATLAKAQPICEVPTLQRRKERPEKVLHLLKVMYMEASRLEPRCVFSKARETHYRKHSHWERATVFFKLIC